MLRQKLILPLILLPILVVACTNQVFRQQTPAVESPVEIPSATMGTSPTVSLTAESVPESKKPVPSLTWTQRNSTQNNLATGLDRTNFNAVMNWLITGLGAKDPQKISELVNGLGTALVNYGTEAQPPGTNNQAEIRQKLTEALLGSDPVCLGFDDQFGRLPDKAMVAFQGIHFEWEKLGQTKSDITAFQFFQTGDNWELVYITPIPEQLWGGLEDSLQPCP